MVTASIFTGLPKALATADTEHTTTCSGQDFKVVLPLVIQPAFNAQLFHTGLIATLDCMTNDPKAPQALAGCEELGQTFWRKYHLQIISRTTMSLFHGDETVAQLTCENPLTVL
jgi:hypothetical protein